MGYYIDFNSKQERPPSTGKIKKLLEDGGSIVSGDVFQENLVCVVDNFIFEAAAYCYDKQEYDVFINDESGRKKTWLIHPNAKKLSGFEK